MLGDTKRLIFDIIAKDHASSTFDKVGRSAGGTAAGGVSRFKKVAVAGLVAATGAAVVFGKKSVQAYQDVAKESSILSRITGESIKDAGRLRFAAHESGVEFTTLSTSMRIFAKNTAGAQGSTTKMKAITDQLGFSIQDAHGKLLPMNELLPKVADRFAKMPDGPQKTALAMKLFGRSGADMIKVLNKGSAGIKELGDQGEKTGNVLKDTEGYKAQLKAQREFQAASTGLKVQLGAALYPILTKLTQYLAEHVGPAFTNVSEFVDHHSQLIGTLAKIMLPLAGIIYAIVKSLRIFTAVMAAVNLVMSANPIGLIIIALAAFAAAVVYAWKHSETFRKVVTGALEGIAKAADWLWNKVLKPVFRFITKAWITVAGAIIHGAANAFGWVPGLGPKLRAAADKFDDFKRKVNNQLDGIKPAKIRVDDKDARNKLREFRRFFLDMIGQLKKKANIHVGASGGIGNILGQTVGHNAAGTSFWRGGRTQVNEEGPEILDLPRGTRIIPAGLSRAMAGGGGDVFHITINGALDPAGVALQVEQMLNQLRRRRGTKLGFVD